MNFSQCRYKEAKDFISVWHYSQYTPPNNTYFKWEECGRTYAMAAFGPLSGSTHSSLLGRTFGIQPSEIVELTRLVRAEPKQTPPLSMFIARCIKELSRRGVRYILSFSDPDAGHSGGIYRASNFHHIGRTASATYLVDQAGKKYHPRSIRTSLKKKGRTPEESGFRYQNVLPKDRWLFCTSAKKARQIQRIWDEFRMEERRTDKSLEAADCDSCPVGGFWRKCSDFAPVPAEAHKKDQMVILGESSSSSDILEGRPFVGPAGRELQAALQELGISRQECQLNNVIACRAPENKLKLFLTKLSRKNKKAKNPSPLPMDCCRPRLMDDLYAHDKIICLGATAAASIMGGKPSIMRVRGSCEVIEMPWGPVKVAYTLHPSFVLQSPKWRSVFRNDIAKALRFFNDDLNWEDPEIQIVKTKREFILGLRRLALAKKPIAYDVETDGINPLSANLRCVGISNDEYSMIVPILSIDGQTRFFEPEVEKSVRGELARWLGAPPAPLLGHNAGQYDRLVCEQHLGATPKLSVDTLLLHLLVDNEMPHRLEFVASVYTDFVESWKAAHTAVTAKSDEELHIYCAKDACVTARIAPAMGKTVKERGQWHLLEREHRLQDVGCGMQRLGMRVDLDRLNQHESDIAIKFEENKAVCRSLISKDFNPLSTTQLRKLLFTEWKLSPEKYNEKTGDPSTDDDTLRRLITHHNLEENQRALVQAVRMVRRYSKLLSTYIKPIRAWGDRVHPAYNRLPATGRYSSSGPNAQNIPAFLRDIFVPEEGHLFVGADMDQLELRLVAEEARVELLLKCINGGLDPHNENMEIVYGKGIWSLDGAPENRKDKGKGTFKRTRGVTKNVFYGFQYGGGIPTIHQQVVSVEDDAGELIYAHMTLRDIRDVVNGLKKAVPEIPRWWNSIRNLFRRQGYIADSIWGRRRDFKDQEKINEMVNHPIQAGGASIVHEAMLELVQGCPGWGTAGSSDLLPSGSLFGFDFEGKTGLVNQCHDSLLFEVKEDDAEEAAKQLQASMTRKRKVGALLTYTAEAEIGKSWLEV